MERTWRQVVPIRRPGCSNIGVHDRSLSQSVHVDWPEGELGHPILAPVTSVSDAAYARGSWLIPPIPNGSTQSSRSRQTRESVLTWKDSASSELLLDPEELIVLGHALGPAKGAGLDLPGCCGYREVGDRRILGLA
jgi:hypothetical protein